MASENRRKLDRIIEGYIERAMRQVQLRAFQSLTSATPVDTGFARAGWSPSTGAPEPGPSNAKSRELALAQAAELFGKHSKAAEALKSGYKLKQGPIFIVNAVVYVPRLNDGYSAQAPSNFIQQAIRQAIAATKRDLRGRGS